MLYLSKREYKTMKTFKELLNEEIFEHGEIFDKKNFDPKNPEVLVKGFGRFKLNQLKKDVQLKLEDLYKKSKLSNFSAINELLNPNGVLVHYVKAILDVERELNSSSIKRKITLMNKDKNKVMFEAAPPDKEIEQWIVDMKPKFKKEYGSKWEEVLYALAWKKYKEKSKK